MAIDDHSVPAPAVERWHSLLRSGDKYLNLKDNFKPIKWSKKSREENQSNEWTTNRCDIAFKERLIEVGPQSGGQRLRVADDCDDSSKSYIKKYNTITAIQSKALNQQLLHCFTPKHLLSS